MIQFKLPSPRRIFTSINALRLLWILVLFCIEHYFPRRATSLCSWPLDGPRECRLAVIADPQIVDENTYPRRGIAMWLTKVFTDRYMRRNWRYVMDQDPGLAIFVGDLMDGGREWEDNLYVSDINEPKDRWIPEYQRFRDVFPAVEGVRISTTIPGNHDIGLGDGIRPARLNRFISHFSSSNSTSEIIETCNFELILLDTPSLLNTQDPSIHESPLTFLENLPDPRPDVPRILFTHIPLYRTPDTSCGAYRESSRPIYYGGGYQYQNTLSEELTNRILDAMWPLAAIFTGDDHDYCLVEHTMEGRREKIPEYTVKSFSWAMVYLDLVKANIRESSILDIIWYPSVQTAAMLLPCLRHDYVSFHHRSMGISST